MRLIRRLLLGLAAATALFTLWLFAIWPPPLWYRTHFPQETAFMRMRGGGSYTPVPLDSVSPLFVRAVLIGEDHRFWEHRGIDYVEVRRALGYRRDGFSWLAPRDVAELSRALAGIWQRREALRGASTITQQLAKNLYLSPSRNPLRKLKEAVTAYRLELALPKRRILELYINVVELGDGVWGVEDASRTYYDRPARRLSRSQAAALAGTLPFPLLSNPSHRPGRMRWRQALILRRMGGERLEVPPVAETPPADLEPLPDIRDSIPMPVLDTLAAPPPPGADSGDSTVF
ncbi:MAG TPA: biosynthetic peptidoglycan transglycosylase [Gemmatimonadales bacterium]|nr:biosynthetic peptidoglycan transglycosylase [Gemmatimonadales bacterium]